MSIHGHCINNLRFADDIDVLASNWEDLQEMVDIVSGDGKKADLIINERKTSFLFINIYASFRNNSSLFSVPVFPDLTVVRDRKVSICFAVFPKKELLRLLVYRAV